MADWKLRDNYLRVSVLLIDGGGFVVKEFVLQNGVIEGGYKTLDDFLALNKTIISGLPRVFRQSQTEILYPVNPVTQVPLPTDIKRWDITLTTAILTNCVGLSPQDTKALNCIKPRLSQQQIDAFKLVVPRLSQKQIDAFKDIRGLRNEVFGHTPAIALSDQEFQTIWKKISTTLKSASKLISQTFEDKLDELVNKIETENISANRAADVEGALNELRLGIEGIQTKVENIDAKLEIFQDNQQKADKTMDEHIKHITESDPLQKAVEHANDRLKAHRKDVTTIGTELCSFGKEELAEKLYADNIVAIAGIPGAGKTYLAFSIMDEFINTHPEIKPLTIRLPQDIKTVIDPFGSYVLLIDDMIGRFHIDSRELQNWNRYADDFLCQLQTGKLYVIITIRLAILKECERAGEIYQLFERYKYTTLDHSFLDESKRLDILLSYIKYKDIGITPKQIQDIVCMKNTQIGFPLLCRKLEKGLDIVNQFKTQTDHIKSEILNLVHKQMTSFFALLMTLFCDNLLNKFNSDKQDTCFELFKSYFGNITKPSIYESADTLESTYFKQPTNGQFAFLHNSIAEAVFGVSMQKYPDFILQQCPFKVLISHLNETDTKIFHPLICRFTTELSKPDFETIIFDMASSPFWKERRFNSQAVKDIDIGYYFKPNNKVRSLFSYFAEFGLSQLLQIIWSTPFKTDKCETQTRNTQLQRAICDACICNKRPCIDYLLTKIGVITEDIMFAAAEGGNIDTFKSLTERYGQEKMESLKHSDTGRSLLHAAAFRGREGILRFLCEKCPSLKNQTDYSSTTAGHIAVEMGHKDCLVALIDLGYNVFIKGKEGITLLHISAKEGQTHIVKYLCKTYQTMIPLINERGQTAVHYAAFKGNVSSFKFLVEQGLDPLKQSSHGTNVLSESIQGGNVSVIQHICKTYPEMLPLICRNKVEKMLKDKDTLRGTWIDLLLTDEYFINETKKYDTTFLHQLALNSDNNTLDMVKHICEKYPHMLNKTDNESRTAAHDAAYGGTVECLKYLVEQGCDPDAITDDNETIFHIAALGGNINVVTYICQQSPHMLNKTDNGSRTAAHHAAINGTVECLKYLIEQGCDPDAITDDNETILHRAALGGNINVVTYICQQYPHMLIKTDNGLRTAAHNAAHKGTVECLKYLIEQGCDPDATTYDNETILHRAALGGNINVVTYICQQYPHMLNKTDNGSETAAHNAAHGGSVPCLKYLIEEGCDPDAITDDNETILHRAALGGNINIVTYICQQYPHMLNKTDNGSRTAAHHAASKGTVDCLKYLIEQGCDPDAITDDNETILHKAALGGNINVVTYVCQQYPHMLNKTDNGSRTAAHHAASKGTVDCLKYLIEQGCDPDAITDDNETILHYAALGGNINVVTYICQQYPHMLNKTDNGSETAAHNAAHGGSVPCLKYLIEQGCDPDAITDDNETILHRAALSGNINIVTYICQQYPHMLNKTDNGSRTAAHHAASKGTVDCLKYLIEQGCDPDAITDDNETILHSAALGGNINVVTFICQQYPHMLNKTYNGSRTAAHHAASKGTVPCLKYLIEQGCDPDAITDDNETILHKAALGGNINVVTYVCQQYPHMLNKTDNGSRTAAHHAASKGTVDCLKYLIEQGCDPDAITDDNETILHYAALGGNINVVTYICQQYPHMLNKTDNGSETAAHNAAHGGSVPCLKYLIEQGCDPDAITDDNETILHRAALSGNINIVTYICQQYPHMLNKTDNGSRTAAHHAASKGTVDCLKYLIEQGCDPDAITDDNETILHSAALGGNINVVTFICQQYPHMLNKTYNGSRTAAHHAASKGTVPCLKYLIEQGCDPDAITDDNETILHRAALSGNINIVTYICQQYPHMLNKTGNGSRTVAHYAASKGTVDCLKYLIEQGCDPDAITDDNETILHFAALGGNINVVTYICQQYPHMLNKTDNGSRTAAHNAANGGSVSCLKYLIEQGCYPDAITDDNETILHRAALGGNINVVTYVCQQYPHMLNKTDNGSRTAAHNAAHKGTVECLKYLIEQGCDPDATTVGKETILNSAALGGNINVVTYICQQYTDMLNKTDNGSETAAHSAAYGGSVPCLKYLIEQGCDPDATNDDNETILHRAALGGNINVVTYICQQYPYMLIKTNNESRTAAHDTAINGTVECLKYLIEQGCDPDATTDDNETILHRAALSGNINVVTYICQQYPDMLNKTDNGSETSAHNAAYGGSVPCLIYLIEQGCDPDATNDNNETILHRAALGGNFNVVTYICQQYPHMLNKTDKRSRTAAHHDYHKGTVECLNYLTEQGCRECKIKKRSCIKKCCLIC